jgi:hypothetical protein
MEFFYIACVSLLFSIHRRIMPESINSATGPEIRRVAIAMAVPGDLSLSDFLLSSHTVHSD